MRPEFAADAAKGSKGWTGVHWAYGDVECHKTPTENCATTLVEIPTQPRCHQPGGFVT